MNSSGTSEAEGGSLARRRPLPAIHFVNPVYLPKPSNKHRPPGAGSLLKEISLNESADRDGPSMLAENQHRSPRRIPGAKQQVARRRFGYRCRNADDEWRLSLEGLTDMSDRFPIFEIILERRRRRWVWSVRTTEGMLVITGSSSSRSAARYEAHRALFLMLLSAPYRSRTSGREIRASQAPAQRSLPPGSLGGRETGCS